MATMPLVVAVAVVHNLHAHIDKVGPFEGPFGQSSRALTHTMLDALHMQNTMKFFEARRVR